MQYTFAPEEWLAALDPSWAPATVSVQGPDPAMALTKKNSESTRMMKSPALGRLATDPTDMLDAPDVYELESVVAGLAELTNCRYAMIYTAWL
jgi:hypothetical protein